METNDLDIVQSDQAENFDSISIERVDVKRLTRGDTVYVGGKWWTVLRPVNWSPGDEWGTIQLLNLPQPVKVRLSRAVMRAKL